MALDPALQPIANHLEQMGWTKVYVPKNASRPDGRLLFTTTIGLQEQFGLPELVVFGFDRTMVDGIIHNVAAQLSRTGWQGGPLQMDGILEDEPVELRTVHQEHFTDVGAVNIVIRRETGRPPLKEMVQIFWTGDDGRFPWDPDAEDDFRDQKRLDISWKNPQ